MFKQSKRESGDSVKGGKIIGIPLFALTAFVGLLVIALVEPSYRMKFNDLAMFVLAMYLGRILPMHH